MSNVKVTITTYASIARAAGVSRQHVRECVLGHRKPGKTLGTMLLEAGAITTGRRTHA